MKILALTFLSVLFSFFSYSQIEKGKSFIGGNISFSTISSNQLYEIGSLQFPINGSTTKSIETSSNFIYFTSNTIAIGFKTGLRYFYRKSQGILLVSPITGFSNYMFYINPFFLKFYKKLGRKTWGFAETEYKFGFGSSLYKTNNNGITSVFKDYLREIDLGIKLGLVYFISDKFSIEATMKFINYTINNNYNDDKNYYYSKSRTYKKFDLSFAHPQFTIGVEYSLNKKKTYNTHNQVDYR